MPIPKPKDGEKQNQYINRCMTAIGGEYEDKKQALGVCFTEWRKKDNLDLNDFFDNDLYVEMDIERINFHGARVKDPGLFEMMRIKELPGTNGILLVLGRLKGQNTTTAQSYLFPKEKFTIQRAKEWLKEKKIKTIKFEPAKKDSGNLVQRYDLFDLQKTELNGIEDPFKRTSEGYLKGCAIITNIGVFPYRNADGSITRELRHPDDVFDELSLESLKMKPIANEHPENIIDMSNIKDFQVGTLGSETRIDAYHVAVPIIITDKQTIEDVEQGRKRGLSAGYNLYLEDQAGNYLGTQYDKRQRNIRYNHVALVDRGRAGDAARIKMDSIIKDTTSAYFIGWDNKNKAKEENMPDLINIKIDEVDYQAEKEVVKSHKKLEKTVKDTELKIEEMKKEKDTIQAERDTFKSKVDKLEKELKDAKNNKDEINNAVKKRLSLLIAAETVGVEIKEDELDIEIQKRVISKHFPDLDLQNKSDEYIQACFDTTMKTIEDRNDRNKRGNDKQNEDDNKESRNSDEARKRMIERAKKRSQGGDA